MKNSKAKPPKFFSLFVPQVEWFQDLLKKKAKNRSLSCYLLQLVMKDLRTRELITKEQYQEYSLHKRPEIRSTRFVDKKEMHDTFSLYIPKTQNKEGVDSNWFREVLDADFLKTNCGATSRSLYIWNLFIRDNKKELSAFHLSHWDRVLAGEHRMSSPKSEEKPRKHASRAS